jgi:SsrA-binding protein
VSRRFDEPPAEMPPPLRRIHDSAPVLFRLNGLAAWRVFAIGGQAAPSTLDAIDISGRDCGKETEGRGRLGPQETSMAAKTEDRTRVVAQNRRARFNYEIGETFEAGIALTGTEVKALRGGKATIAESYADARGNEIWLVNANIPEYLQGGRFNHAPKRVRKLLLHRRQIDKLMGAVEREGMTLVPLKLYFNEKGRAKVELALARGKKLHDKRETEKKRSWERERGRLLRAKG